MSIKSNPETLKTSIRYTDKKPSVYKYLPEGNGKTLLDYGCGKYPETMEKLANNHGYNWVGFEPHSEPPLIPPTRFFGYQTVICSNVLNTITNDDILDNIINDIAENGNPHTTFYISVYSGNSSGIHSELQRNEKPARYREKLLEYFSEVTLNTNVFICKL